MKKALLVFVLLLFGGHTSFAQLVYSYEQTVCGNITMPYRKALIAQDNEGLSSLVVYLHGGSSKGNDNELPLQEPGTDSIANYLVRKNIKSIFVVPQCPKNKSWGGPMNNAVETMLSSLLSSGLVDADRVYILGGSMGGTGTWGMVSVYPDLFAAAMPVAGNPSHSNAEAVSNTPVYTVMGTADTIMSIDVVAEFLQELETYGGEYMFDIEEEWTHQQTCIESYTEARLDWVFSHPANLSVGNETADAITDSKTFAYFSAGNCFISNEGAATLQVINLMGHFLSSEVINGNFTKRLDVPVGIYLLRLIKDGNVKTQKIVVK